MITTRRTWLCPGCGCPMVTGDRRGNARYCSRRCAQRYQHRIYRLARYRLAAMYPAEYRQLIADIRKEQS